MTTILIVEDEPTSLGVFSLALERAGYRVVTAPDGADALAVLETLLPQLILCDVIMPTLGGIELGERLQRDPRYRHIPIILMSALAIRAQDLSFQPAAMLEKPVSLERLYAAVADALHQADSQGVSSGA
jgi:CheY-like chemotaxis protein